MSKILQLDSSGQPMCWISWQDAVVYYAKDLVSWSIGEITFTARGGNNRLTGQQSVITTAPIIAIKGAPGKRWKTNPALTNRRLFQRDRYMCAYCGKIFQECDLTRDHIVPTSRGGEDTWMNCVTACSVCNGKKGDKLLSECNLSLVYVPYVPNRYENLILENRAILKDQMDFLVDFLPSNSKLLKDLKNEKS